MDDIKKLFTIVGYKKRFLIILIFSIVVMLLEVLGLVSLIPYISVATNKVIPENAYLERILLFLNIDTYEGFIVLFTIVLISFYILRFIINLSYNYLLLNFVNRIRHEIMSKLFAHYSYIDYSHFFARNTAVFRRTLIGESANIQSIIKSIIFIISELFLIIIILALLIYVNWQLSLGLFITAMICFLIVTKLLKQKISEIAVKRSEHARDLNVHTEEMLRNFKLNKITGSEDIKIKLFDINSFSLARVNVLFQLFSSVPRIILETVGLIFIVLMMFYLVMNNFSENLISTIGIYAISFYRLLPSINRIISEYNSLQYFKNTITILHEDFHIEKEDFNNETLSFKEKIEFKNIKYKYKDTEKYIFDDFNLILNKNEKIAITGESGSGKSTLIDILMGLLKLEKGTITVDNHEIGELNMLNWRSKFGYIPQEIYLFDSTVADNISFGREYDEDKVIKVLKQANIYDYLQTKEGIETIVGEGGIQLSGGQKQRIGIARALYNNPEILVLDEATSALDESTESLIMDEIYRISENKTLIIIAHRLSTVEKCDRKIEL